MTKGSGSDAFVTLINTAGSAFIYSSFLGGSEGNGNDYGYAIAVDSRDNAYVAGKTSSTDYPIVSPFQSLYGGGPTDAFVARIHPLGSSLTYSTYLGGSGTDVANGITVDSVENIYITGSTISTNFPVVYGSYDAICGTDGNCNSSKYDAFVVSLKADGSSPSYSTYLGGSDNDFGKSIAVSDSGRVSVGGYTTSADFPVKSPVQAIFGGVTDAFVSRLNATGVGLDYSTFLGGSNADQAMSIAGDGAGNVFVAGNTISTNFPTSSPIQAGSAGLTDAFIARIGAVADLWVTITDSIDPVDANSEFSYTIFVTNNGPDTATNTILTDILPSGLSFVSATSTQGTCSGTATITCALGDMANDSTAMITMNVVATQAITNAIDITSATDDNDTSNNIDSEPTAVNASSQTSAITSSGSGGGSDYGLFLIMLMYIALAGINGRSRCFATRSTDD